jgi:hypothetical protein
VAEVSPAEAVAEVSLMWFYVMLVLPLVFFHAKSFSVD